MRSRAKVTTMLALTTVVAFVASSCGDNGTDDGGLTNSPVTEVLPNVTVESVGTSTLPTRPEADGPDSGQTVGVVSVEGLEVTPVGDAVVTRPVALQAGDAIRVRAFAPESAVRMAISSSSVSNLQMVIDGAEEYNEFVGFFSDAGVSRYSGPSSLESWTDPGSNSTPLVNPLIDSFNLYSSDVDGIYDIENPFNEWRSPNLQNGWLVFVAPATGAYELAIRLEDSDAAPTGPVVVDYDIRSIDPNVVAAVFDPNDLDEASYRAALDSQVAFLTDENFFPTDRYSALEDEAHCSSDGTNDGACTVTPPELQYFGPGLDR